MNAQEGDKNCQKERLKEERKKTNRGAEMETPSTQPSQWVERGSGYGAETGSRVGSKNELTLLPGRLGFEGPGEV